MCIYSIAEKDTKLFWFGWETRLIIEQVKQWADDYFPEVNKEWNRRIDFKPHCSKILECTKHLLGRRHGKVLRKFAASSFLYAGSMACNLIHKNTLTAFTLCMKLTGCKLVCASM